VVAIVLPWLFVILLVLDSGSADTKLFKFMSVSAIGSSFIVILWIYIGSYLGHIYSSELTTIGKGVSIGFFVDQLGAFFAVVTGFVWLLATIYATVIIHHNQTRYFCFSAIVFASVIGVAFASNLFTLLIFWELMSYGSYPIIAHKGTVQARRAANRYLIYAITAGSLIFLSVLITYSLASSLTLTRAGILPFSQGSKLPYLLFFTFVAGFGIKAAIFPLHGWLPEAHTQAPSSASALISTILTGLGVFGIIRVIYNVFGVRLVAVLKLDWFLVYMGAFTIIYGSIMAISQNNIKKRLAYSSISQCSYPLLGVALLNFNGLLGGVIHIAHHAFMKASLFLAAGIIIENTGNSLISKMGGVGKKFPITMGAFATSALGMIGIPPLVGFISKWVLGVATLDASKTIFLVVIFVSSILNALYYLPIIYIAFFREGRKTALGKHSQVRHAMLYPLLGVTSAVVIFGIFARIRFAPYNLAVSAVRQLFPRTAKVVKSPLFVLPH
jgi:multicomponent Na+:H+ antiporter subunit D